MKRVASILLIPVLSVSFLGGCGGEKEKKANSLKIGISIYDQYDTFISEEISQLKAYAKEMEKEWNMTITLEVLDASQNQLTQNDQMDDFINRGYDVACINLVDRTDASTIIEKAKSADVPVIFFNRELVEEDLERWNRLYYVGADAFESGILQGEILSETCKTEFDKIDKN